MDVHPTKNVSIGIDPYPNRKNWGFTDLGDAGRWFQDGSKPLDKKASSSSTLRLLSMTCHSLPRPAANATKRTAGGEPKNPPRPTPKGKSNGRGTPAPPTRELLGHASTPKSGQPICCDLNLTHGCQQAKPGQRCVTGLHICCERGCGKGHSLAEHTEWLCIVERTSTSAMPLRALVCLFFLMFDDKWRENQRETNAKPLI